MNDITRQYSLIQKRINSLIEANKTVDPKLYKHQLKVIKTLDAELEQSKEESIRVYTLRLRYNVMMKYFSEKLGLGIEKYDNIIEELSRKMGIPEGE